VENGYSA